MTDPNSNESKTDIPSLIPHPKNMADTLLNALFANLVIDPAVRDRKKHMTLNDMKALFQRSSFAFILFQSTVRLYYTMFNQMCAYMARFKVQYLPHLEIAKHDKLTKTEKAKLLRMKQDDIAYASSVIRMAIEWTAENRDDRTGQAPPILKMLEFLGIKDDFIQSEMRPSDACWNCHKLLLDGTSPGKFCSDCGAVAQPDSTLGIQYVDLIRRCENEMRELGNKSSTATPQMPTIHEEEEKKQDEPIPPLETSVVRHYRPCATCRCYFECANTCSWCGEPWNQPWFKIKEGSRKLWRDNHDKECKRCKDLAVCPSEPTTDPVTETTGGTSPDSGSRTSVEVHAESHANDAGSSVASGRIEPSPLTGNASDEEAHSPISSSNSKDEEAKDLSESTVLI